MDIFFLKKSEILKSVSKFDTVFKSEKRNIEYQIGRYLTKYIGKVFYELFDVDIIVTDKKPVFKNSKMCFSISHSDEYVVVAFSEKEIGLDIEKYKERNLEKFSKYFKRDFGTQEEFYKYWTSFEAKYKSKLKNEFCSSFRFRNYYLSISSLEEHENISFYELYNLSKTETLLDELKLEIEEVSKEEII